LLLRAQPAHAATVLAPILEVIERHPDHVHWIVQGLISREDQHKNTVQFWMVWRLFAEKVKAASWIAHLDDDFCAGRDLMTAMFLGTWWKDEVRHWTSLEGHAGKVDDFFESLPATSAVLGNYVRFLYQIGARSLPGGFIRIAERLRAGKPSAMLSDGNTVFMLERILERHVYARPLELKTNKKMQTAVLFVLDLLVDAGSSAAFRMRDDFVTPLPVA
jgi:hypothetical protein